MPTFPAYSRLLRHHEMPSRTQVRLQGANSLIMSPQGPSSDSPPCFCWYSSHFDGCLAGDERVSGYLNLNKSHLNPDLSVLCKHISFLGMSTLVSWRNTLLWRVERQLVGLDTYFLN